MTNRQAEGVEQAWRDYHDGRLDLRATQRRVMEFSMGTFKRTDRDVPAARDLGLPTGSRDPGKATYLRVGGWDPKSPRSRNYARGSIEAGLSVYDLDDGENPKVPPEGEWAEVDMNDRLRGPEPKFLVQGDYIGVGGDGEPLLANVRVVGEWKRKR